MSWTLQEARDNLARVQEAYNATLQSQQWSASGRQLSRATLFRMSEELRMWRRIVDRLEQGGMSVRRVQPVDENGHGSGYGTGRGRGYGYW